MNRYDLLASMLYANEGVIRDRTVVQKLAYFANLRLGNEEISYRDYFYGPFSKEVALGLEHLASSLFIREIVRKTPIERYTYELTEDGMYLAAKAVEESPREHDVVKSVLATCREHCSLHARPMSCAAKIHFMLEHEPGHDPSPPGMRAMALDFGWNMTDREIDQGMALLRWLEGTGVAAWRCGSGASEYLARP